MRLTLESAVTEAPVASTKYASVSLKLHGSTTHVLGSRFLELSIMVCSLRMISQTCSLCFAFPLLKVKASYKNIKYNFFMGRSYDDGDDYL